MEWLQLSHDVLCPRMWLVPSKQQSGKGDTKLKQKRFPSLRFSSRASDLTESQPSQRSQKKKKKQNIFIVYSLYLIKTGFFHTCGGNRNHSLSYLFSQFLLVLGTCIQADCALHPLLFIEVFSDCFRWL